MSKAGSDYKLCGLVCVHYVSSLNLNLQIYKIWKFNYISDVIREI